MEAQQFDLGDIIIIDDKPVEEDITLYQIYAYKKDGKTIIHRLYEINRGDTNTYLFRGDANIGSDDKYVNYEDIIGVYNRVLISDIGMVVLFSQSYYGFYILLSIVTILTASSIFERKIYLLLKKRASRSILIAPIIENNETVKETLQSDLIDDTEETESSSLDRKNKKRFIGKIVWNSKRHKPKEVEPEQNDKE
jgi:signal peptidase I